MEGSENDFILPGLEESQPAIAQFSRSSIVEPVKAHSHWQEVEEDLISPEEFSRHLNEFCLEKKPLLNNHTSAFFPKQKDVGITDTPALENFMKVPAADRKKHFFDMSTAGDILVGSVQAVTASGLDITLICTDCGKTRDIHDLNIKAFCNVRDIEPPLLQVPADEMHDGNNQDGRLPDNPLHVKDTEKKHEVKSIAEENENIMERFHIKDYVRGVLLGFHEEMAIMSMCNEDLNLSPICPSTNLILGKIEEENLPQYYKWAIQLKKLPFTEQIKQLTSFTDPLNGKVLNAAAIEEPSALSLMSNLQRCNYNKEDYADELRKRQIQQHSHQNVSRGIEYTREGRYHRALQCLDEALHADPCCIDALVAKGAVLASLEDYSEAVKSLESALELDPQSHKAKMYLCETLIVFSTSLLECGREQEAVPHLKKILSIDSVNEEAQSLLNQIEYKPPPLMLGDSSLKSASKEDHKKTSKKAKKSKHRNRSKSPDKKESESNLSQTNVFANELEPELSKRHSKSLFESKAEEFKGGSNIGNKPQADSAGKDLNLELDKEKKDSKKRKNRHRKHSSSKKIADLERDGSPRSKKRKVKNGSSLQPEGLQEQSSSESDTEEKESEKTKKIPKKKKKEKSKKKKKDKKKKTKEEKKLEKEKKKLEKLEKKKEKKQKQQGLKSEKNDNSQTNEEKTAAEEKISGREPDEEGKKSSVKLADVGESGTGSGKMSKPDKKNETDKSDETNESNEEGSKLSEIREIEECSVRISPRDEMLYLQDVNFQKQIKKVLCMSGVDVKNPKTYIMKALQRVGVEIVKKDIVDVRRTLRRMKLALVQKAPVYVEFSNESIRDKVYSVRDSLHKDITSVEECLGRRLLSLYQGARHYMSKGKLYGVETRDGRVCVVLHSNKKKLIHVKNTKQLDALVRLEPPDLPRGETERQNVRDMVPILNSEKDKNKKDGGSADMVSILNSEKDKNKKDGGSAEQVKNILEVRPAAHRGFSSDEESDEELYQRSSSARMVRCDIPLLATEEQQVKEEEQLCEENRLKLCFLAVLPSKKDWGSFSKSELKQEIMNIIPKMGVDVTDRDINKCEYIGGSHQRNPPICVTFQHMDARNRVYRARMRQKEFFVNPCFTHRQNALHKLARAKFKLKELSLVSVVDSRIAVGLPKCTELIEVFTKRQLCALIEQYYKRLRDEATLASRRGLEESLKLKRRSRSLERSHDKKSANDSLRRRLKERRLSCSGRRSRENEMGHSRSDASRGREKERSIDSSRSMSNSPQTVQFDWKSLEEKSHTFKEQSSSQAPTLKFVVKNDAKESTETSLFKSVFQQDTDKDKFKLTDDYRSPYSPEDERFYKRNSFSFDKEDHGYPPSSTQEHRSEDPINKHKEKKIIKTIQKSRWRSSSSSSGNGSGSESDHSSKNQSKYSDDKVEEKESKPEFDENFVRKQLEIYSRDGREQQKLMRDVLFIGMHNVATSPMLKEKVVLLISSTNVLEVEDKDIVQCGVLGENKEKISIVTVTFKTKAIRDRVLKLQCITLSPERVFLRERLCQGRSEILSHALMLKKQGQIFDMSTVNGEVHVQMTNNSTSFEVHSVQHLQRLADLLQQGEQYQHLLNLKLVLKRLESTKQNAIEKPSKCTDDVKLPCLEKFLSKINLSQYEKENQTQRKFRNQLFFILGPKDNIFDTSSQKVKEDFFLAPRQDPFKIKKLIQQILRIGGKLNVFDKDIGFFYSPKGYPGATKCKRLTVHFKNQVVRDKILKLGSVPAPNKEVLLIQETLAPQRRRIKMVADKMKENGAIYDVSVRDGRVFVCFEKEGKLLEVGSIAHLQHCSTVFKNQKQIAMKQTQSKKACISKQASPVSKRAKVVKKKKLATNKKGKEASIGKASRSSITSKAAAKRVWKSDESDGDSVKSGNFYGEVDVKREVSEEHGRVQKVRRSRSMSRDEATRKTSCKNKSVRTIKEIKGEKTHTFRDMLGDAFKRVSGDVDVPKSALETDRGSRKKIKKEIKKEKYPETFKHIEMPTFKHFKYENPEMMLQSIKKEPSYQPQESLNDKEEIEVWPNRIKVEHDGHSPQRIRQYSADSNEHRRISATKSPEVKRSTRPAPSWFEVVSDYEDKEAEQNKSSQLSPGSDDLYQFSEDEFTNASRLQDSKSFQKELNIKREPVFDSEQRLGKAFSEYRSSEQRNEREAEEEDDFLQVKPVCRASQKGEPLRREGEIKRKAEPIKQEHVAADSRVDKQDSPVEEESDDDQFLKLSKRLQQFRSQAGYLQPEDDHYTKQPEQERASTPPQEQQIWRAERETGGNVMPASQKIETLFEKISETVTANEISSRRSVERRTGSPVRHYRKAAKSPHRLSRSRSRGRGHSRPKSPSRQYSRSRSRERYYGGSFRSWQRSPSPWSRRHSRSRSRSFESRRYTARSPSRGRYYPRPREEAYTRFQRSRSRSPRLQPPHSYQSPYPASHQYDHRPMHTPSEEYTSPYPAHSPPPGHSYAKAQDEDQLAKIQQQFLEENQRVLQSRMSYQTSPGDNRQGFNPFNVDHRERQYFDYRTSYDHQDRPRYLDPRNSKLNYDRRY